jgi:hypothetical protein
MSNLNIQHWKGVLTKNNIITFCEDLAILEKDQELIVFKVKKKDIELFKDAEYVSDIQLIAKIEKLIQQENK